MPDLSRRKFAALTCVAIANFAACSQDSSDGDAAPTSSVVPSVTAEADGDYCERAGEYDEATRNVDVSIAAATVDSLEAAAVAARALAEAAPATVREVHVTLAYAAEDLVAALRQRNPDSVADLETALADVSSELEAEYGSLESETAAVIDHVAATCGFTPDPG